MIMQGFYYQVSIIFRFLLWQSGPGGDICYARSPTIYPDPRPINHPFFLSVHLKNAMHNLS